MKYLIMGMCLLCLLPIYNRLLSDMAISDATNIKNVGEKIRILSLSSTMESQYYLSRIMIKEGMDNVKMPVKHRSELIYYGCVYLREIQKYAPGYKKMENMLKLLAATSEDSGGVGIHFDRDKLLLYRLPR